MNLDILAIVAHPDDAELSFGGTLISHQQKGYKTGILDLTQGELGSRGTPKIRLQEAQKAKKILKVSIRDNAQLEDGFFQNTKESQLLIAKYIRQYRPKVVITNAIYDRHPDHPRAAELVETSCFISGLKSVSTIHDGKEQSPWRPIKIYFSIQSTFQQPDLLVDISDVMDIKMKAVLAFGSQVFNPQLKTDEPETLISSESFMSMLNARAREWGQQIGVEYAEGFKVKHALGVKNLFDLT